MQATVEKLFRLKTQQQSELKKSKERYQSDHLKLNSFLAQQNLLMGRELEKNNVKLEKVQSSLQESQAEYQSAVTALQETTERWNRDWKLACDTFQDLEEERITNLKTSLWNYANILSQVCVTDDESCEKLRLILEQCDVEADIRTFIETRRTGDEIVDAPVVSDFRGDLDESPRHSFQRARFIRATEISDVKSAIANRGDSLVSRTSTPGSRSGHQTAVSRSGFNESSKAVINQYPLDGITQLCRSDSTVTIQSAASSVPASNVTASSIYSSIAGSHRQTPSTSAVAQHVPAQDHSKPDRTTSRRKSFIERAELSWPMRRSPSPAKSDSPKPLKAQKTGGSMFDALLPARSRSRAGRTTTIKMQEASAEAADVLHVGENMFPIADQENPHSFTNRRSANDPIAAALDKLKISQGSAVRATHSNSSSAYEHSASAYDHVGRRPPPLTSSRGIHTRIPSRSEPSSPVSGADFDYPLRQHPNTYTSINARGGGLGAPPAAHSAAEMRQTADKYMHSKQNILHRDAKGDQSQDRRGQRYPETYNSRGLQHSKIDSTSANQSTPSYRAPGDLRRSPSPVPPTNQDFPKAMRYDEYDRSTSHLDTRASSPRAVLLSNQQYLPLLRADQQDIDFGLESPSGGELDRRSSRSPRPIQPRSISPRPQAIDDRSRPRSRQSARSNQSFGSGFLSGTDSRALSRSGREEAGVSPHLGYGDPRYDPTRGREPQHASPTAIYRPLNRARSKSFVDLTKPGARFTSDGREILILAVALYDYVATIPEEIGFCQGDTLAIVEMREDGWWLGEVTNLKHSRRGLVPSNFFRKIN